MKIKLDNFGLGVLLGLVAPSIGILIFYLVNYSLQNISSFLEFFITVGIINFCNVKSSFPIYTTCLTCLKLTIPTGLALALNSTLGVWEPFPHPFRNNMQRGLLGYTAASKFALLASPYTFTCNRRYCSFRVRYGSCRWKVGKVCSRDQNKVCRLTSCLRQVAGRVCSRN